jgi:aryl-alcohol dehydrogenase-like predicted oxidoreductase
MDSRAIGSLRVTVVGLGCNNFGRRVDAEGTDRVVGAALDAGINFFDTADIYGGTAARSFSAARSGTAAARSFSRRSSAWRVDERRQRRPARVRARALEDSLRRLGTDYVDLYQLHEPDPTTSDLRDARRRSTRSCARERFVRSAARTSRRSRSSRPTRPPGTAPRGFVSVQNEYSLLHREPEIGVLRECARLGLAFIPYFPLASGLLTGKYQRARRPRRDAPFGRRAARALPGRTAPRGRREAARVRGVARAHAPRARLRIPPRASSGRERDRRRHPARAGGRERRRGRWRLTEEELDEVDGLAPAPGRPAESISAR